MRNRKVCKGCGREFGDDGKCSKCNRCGRCCGSSRVSGSCANKYELKGAASKAKSDVAYGSWEHKRWRQVEL